MIRCACLGVCLSTTLSMACPVPPEAIALTSDDAGAPVAYALIDETPVSAPFKVEIAFCDLANEAEALKFDAIMPAHQHGMNFTVDVAQTGAGQFEVSNVVFHMPGLWQMQIAVEIENAAYTYKSEVLLE